MSNFFHTIAGHRLLEHTLPTLVREIGRLATGLERLAAGAEQLVAALGAGAKLTVEVHVQRVERCDPPA